MWPPVVPNWKSLISPNGCPLVSLRQRGGEALGRWSLLDLNRAPGSESALFLALWRALLSLYCYRLAYVARQQAMYATGVWLRESGLRRDLQVLRLPAAWISTPTMGIFWWTTPRTL